MSVEGWRRAPPAAAGCRHPAPACTRALRVAIHHLAEFLGHAVERLLHVLLEIVWCRPACVRCSCFSFSSMVLARFSRSADRSAWRPGSATASSGSSICVVERLQLLALRLILLLQIGEIALELVGCVTASWKRSRRSLVGALAERCGARHRLAAAERQAWFMDAMLRPRAEDARQRIADPREYNEGVSSEHDSSFNREDPLIISGRSRAANARA